MATAEQPAPLNTWISAYVSQSGETSDNLRWMQIVRYETLDNEPCVYVRDEVGGAARWLSVTDDRIVWPKRSTGSLTFEPYDQRNRLRDLYGRPKA